MKLSLKKILGRTSVTFAELQTLLCRVKAILNDRPLTYVSESEDIEELQPLTPQHFLLGRRSSQIIQSERNVPVTNLSLNNRHKYRERLLKSFWEKWKKEYLPTLLCRDRRKPAKVPKVGDVVLVEFDERKRQDWPLAKVEQIMLSADGKIRSVNIRMNGKSFKRPIQKLYPMEISN